MLARAHRLTRGQDFSEAIRRGRRAGTATVVLHLLVRQLTEPAEPQVGLVVSRGVGNAVTRNQVKRRLRHVVRERLGVLPQGSQLVIRALPAAGHGSSVALGRDVDTALRRVLGSPR
jgi:ribonuclease P protein component